MHTQIRTHLFKSLTAITLLAGLCAPLCAEPAAAPMSLGEAIQRALKHSPNTRGAALETEGAQAQRQASLLSMLPRLKLSADLQFWNQAIDLTMAAGPKPDTTYLPPQFAGLIESSYAPIRVRDQLTAAASLTLAQPLTSLYALYTAYQLQSRNLEAVVIGQDSVAQALAAQTAEAYFQALIAQAAAESARQAITLLEAVQKRTQAFVEAGVLSPAELSKVRVNRAQAEEGLIRAGLGVQLTRAQLTLLTGTEHFTLQTPHSPSLNTPPPPFEESKRLALLHRPELKALSTRIQQAKTSVQLAQAAFVPEVTAVASYNFTQGNNFNARHSFFIGGQLSWNFLEMGTALYQAKAAQAAALGVMNKERQAQEGIVMELVKAHGEVVAAQESLKAAQISLEATTALLKDEEARFGVGNTTTTDLLQAQNAALNAEMNLLTARLKVLSAKINLKKATGLIKIDF